MTKQKKTKKPTKLDKINEVEKELEDDSYKTLGKDTAPSEPVSFGKQTFTVMVVSFLLIVIIALWGVYFLGSHNANKSEAKEETKPTTTSIEQVERSLSGKSLEEDKKDVLKSAQDLLKASSDTTDGTSMVEKIEALDTGDVSVVSEDLENRIRFQDDFKIDENLQATTYQSLMVLATYISEEDFAFVSEDVWEEVYVDQEAGVAFVPVSAFYSQGSTFSLEFVYIDGEWKLSPYSFLNAVNMSASIQENQAANNEGVVPSVPTE